MATARPAKRSKNSSQEEGSFLFIKGIQADGLAAALAVARKAGLLCDAEVQCSSSEGSHSAHRVVLAARSDYMKALLASDRFADSSDRIIRLPEVSYSAMGKILQWMYGESFYLESLEETLEFTEAASILQCVNLLHLLDRRLSPKVKIENCIPLLNLADRTNLGAVAAVAERVAVRGYQLIAGTDDFLSVSPRVLQKLVRDDDLAAAEERDVFLSIIRWARSQDEEVVAANLATLVSSVRYQFISKEFYSQTVEKEPLLEKYPACFHAIARTHAGSMNGCDGCKTRRGVRAMWDDLKVGMMAKVICDTVVLKRLCKEQKKGWNGMKRNLAGKQLKVTCVHEQDGSIRLDEGNWTLPLQAIELSDGTEERYLSSDYPWLAEYDEESDEAPDWLNGGMGGDTSSDVESDDFIPPPSP